jgi:hypothetical protein
MGFERRRTWVAMALAAALAMAVAPAGGEELLQRSHTRGAKISASGSVSGRLVRHDTTRERDSIGCTVTLHEYHYNDGNRRSVKQTVCDDGAMRELERHYDAQGHLAKVSEHEITADGAVLFVKDADEGAVRAADASAEGADPKLPDVSADKADRERIKEWLDAKFKEWNAEVEAPETPPGPLRELGED